MYINVYWIKKFNFIKGIIMELKVFDIKISSFNRLKRIKYNYVFDGSILVRNVGLFKKKISSIFFDYYDKEK